MNETKNVLSALGPLSLSFLPSTHPSFHPSTLLFKLFYLFWLCRVFVAAGASSSCSEQELLSSCVWAPRSGGFSCRGAEALGCMGSAVVASGLRS